MYKTLLRNILLVITLLLLISKPVYSGHRGGGTWGWECLGGNTYVISFTIFTDCAHNLDKNTKYCMSGSLGGDPNNVIDVALDSAYSTPHPVDLCPSGSNCTNGGFSWITEVVYTDTITLVSPISPWYTVEFCDGGNRPNGDNGSDGKFYNAASFYTGPPVTCNTAATATNFHEVIYCVGDTAIIQNDYFDADGDSLSFYLVSCLNNVADSMVLDPPFTGQNPLSSSIGWQIDSVGNILFLPDMVMNGQVCMQVEEWSNGILVGQSVNDVFITITNCTPSYISESPTNTTTVAGVDSCLRIYFTDSLVANYEVTTSVIMDPVLIANGATWTSYPVDDQTNYGDFCWFPPCSFSGSGPYFIDIIVQDNACPLTVTDTIRHWVYIDPPIQPVANFSLISDTCSSPLTIDFNNISTGDTAWTWDFGDPASGGLNTSTLEFPSHTYLPGTYLVTLNAANTCLDSTYTQEFSIFDPPYTNVGNDTIVCNYETDMDLSGTISGLTNTGIWTSSGGGTFFVSNTSLNPNYTFSAADYSSGFVDLILTSTNNGICQVSIDTIVVGIDNLQDTVEVLAAYNGANISCNGAADALIGVSINSGVGPYNYQWGPNTGNQTAPILINIGPGWHYIVITDAAGCIATDSILVTEPDVITTTTSVLTDFNGSNISCNGETDAIIEVVAVGGTAPYTYLWSANTGNQITPSVSNLGIGVYTVTVTDANSCVSNNSVTVSGPNALSISASAVTNYNGFNISCSGLSDGGATVTVSGGIPPYTFDWGPNSGNQTTQTASNLPVGNYNVIVTDVNGCFVITSVVLTQPSSLSTTTLVTSNFNSEDVSCFNSSDGEAMMIPLGGVTPYSTLWDANTGSQTTQTVTNLSIGQYFVTLTDANGCSITDSITLTGPAPINITTSILSGFNGQNVSCAGSSDGEVNATATGGASPLSYQWDANAGNQTTQTAINLSEGTYYITVTDINNCSAIDSVSLFDPSVITVTAGVISNYNGPNVSCFGSANGTANVNAFGGVAPYSFLWDPGAGSQTTQLVTGLSAGAYSVTVTDANNCNATAFVTVTEPTQIVTVPIVTSIYNGQQISCNGASDGVIDLTTSGGTPVYSYVWSGPNGFTSGSPDINSLEAGSYNITVTDINGCISTAAINVSEPMVLQNIVVPQDVTCSGLCNGSVEAQVLGGTAPYSYQWDDNNFSTTALVSNLCIGTFSVSVIDVNGCSITGQGIVAEPTPFVLTPTIVNANCLQNNGSICVSVTGGLAPYTYLWNDPAAQTTSCLTATTAGCYNLILTDANSCQHTEQFCINNSPGPTATLIDSSNVSCFGGTDGFVEFSVTGGALPYNGITWLRDGISISPLFDNQTIATGLDVACYTIVIEDSAGCLQVNTSCITEPDVLNGAITQSTDPLCFLDCNGTATISISGGTTPYTYSWGGGSTPTQALNGGLCSGPVSISITDANGCTGLFSHTVVEPTALSSTIAVSSDYNGSELSCYGASDGEVTIVPNGGTIPYTYLWSSNAASQTSQTATGLGSGTYFVDIIDANGCVFTTSYAQIDPPQLLTDFIGVISNYNGTQISCYDYSDGIALISTTGGTSPFTFLWDASTGNQTTQSAVNLAEGTYSVTVTDINGCTLVDSTSIVHPDSVYVEIQGDTAICLGSFANMFAQPTGGTTPYYYLWDNGVDTVAISGDSPSVDTQYSVTVTDANGCFATNVHTVLVSPEVFVDIFTPDTVCLGVPSDISALANSGLGPYTYTWNEGLPSDSAHVVTPGQTTTYVVVATDACNTVATDSVLITVISSDVSFTADTVEGCAPLEVQFSSAVSPVDNYIYAWDFGDGNNSSLENPSNLYLDSGAYTVSLTVLDSYGCYSSLTDTNYINVYPIPTASFTTSNGEFVYSEFDPIVTFVNNSEQDSSWIWNFGDGNGSGEENPTHEFNSFGTYNVILTVTSEYGCTDNTEVEIIIEPETSFYVPNTFTPNGDGNNDYFQPDGIGVDKDQYELWIWDRWGNLIFFSQRFNDPWDGGRSGNGSEKAPDGTYVYRIRIRDVTGTQHRYDGHVNLLK